MCEEDVHEMMCEGGVNEVCVKCMCNEEGVNEGEVNEEGAS